MWQSTGTSLSVVQYVYYQRGHCPWLADGIYWATCWMTDYTDRVVMPFVTKRGREVCVCAAAAGVKRPPPRLIRQLITAFLLFGTTCMSICERKPQHEFIQLVSRTARFCMHASTGGIRTYACIPLCSLRSLIWDTCLVDPVGVSSEDGLPRQFAVFLRV